MSDTEQDRAPQYDSRGNADAIGARYSLREMMEEVKVERQESVFGRELVDSTEIEKMFSKRILKKKRK